MKNISQVLVTLPDGDEFNFENATYTIHSSGLVYTIQVFDGISPSSTISYSVNNVVSIEESVIEIE